MSNACWMTRPRRRRCLQTSDSEELQTWHGAINAVSLCIRHTCTATLSDLPTLPVSTNIGPSSHSEVQKRTLAQTRTDTLKSDNQRWQTQKIVLHFRAMRESDAPAARGKGDSSGGEHAEIKAAFQWMPCWPVRGLVAVSRHDNKHRGVQHVAR